mgnify:CR=1 FL=1
MKRISSFALAVSVILSCAFGTVSAETFEEAFASFEEALASFNYVSYIDTDRGRMVDMDNSNIDAPFTLTLAVCPVPWDAKEGEKVTAFSGKLGDMLPDSGKTAVRENKRSISIYDENGTKVNSFDLLDEEVYMKHIVSDIPLYEGGAPDTVTDGWIDVEGNFVDCFESYDVERSTYVYCTGIGMNVYDNLDRFDNVWFTDSGIMVIEITQTYREYNVNKFGMEKPAVSSSGELLTAAKTFSEGMTESDLLFDPYAVEWYTPKGELILKSEGKWGRRYYTDLFSQIQNGTYDPKAHEWQEGMERKAFSGFVTDGTGTLYLDKSGSFLEGWKKIKGKTYYFSDIGYMTVKPSVINGILYSFDEDGTYRGRYSGWAKVSGKYRYYLRGKKLVGRYRIGGKLYSFDKNGYARAIRE